MEQSAEASGLGSDPDGKQSALQKKRPVAIQLIVMLDVLIGFSFGLLLAQGLANGSFYDHWLSCVFASGLGSLGILFIATSIALLAPKPIGWWLGMLAHGILAMCISLGYFVALYFLVDSWGVENRYYKGGDFLSVAIVTVVFLVMLAIPAVPVMVLWRGKYRRHYSQKLLHK